MTAARDLDAAGIRDPRLRASYRACRRINASYGRTFYLATLLLTRDRRPAVHALYAFARQADEVVDKADPSMATEERSRRLDALAAALADGGGDDVVIPAVRDTARRYRIAPELFDDFMASMRMDLTRSSYRTWHDLLRYMEGSAAAIGSQLLPVLGTVPGADAEAEAEAYARHLGIAFQLTNFIRDVGEDLSRGRVYLPETDLSRFSVTRADLVAGVVTDDVARLLAFEVERTHELYRAAEPGIELLHPASRDCVRTAFTLYRAILDEVERSGYRVFNHRARVAVRRRAVALPAARRARRVRRSAQATNSP
jgi:phytoene synthase